MAKKPSSIDLALYADFMPRLAGDTRSTPSSCRLAISSTLITEGPEGRARSGINEPTQPLLQSIAGGNRAEPRRRRRRRIGRQLTRDPGVFSQSDESRARTRAAETAAR